MFFNGKPIGAVVGQVFDLNGELLPVKYGTATTSASGATQVVAAVSGKRIHVLSGSISAAGTVSVSLTSGSDGMRVTGALPLVANSVVPVIETRTNPGEGLFLFLSAAVSVSVEVAYVESSAPWEGVFLAHNYGPVILGLDINQLASRNAGTGAIGDAVTTVDPIDVLHRSNSSNKLTPTGTIRYVQGALGVGIRNFSDSTGLDWTNANNGRAVWKNLSGGTMVWVYTPSGLSGTNVMCLFYDNAGNTRFQLTINSASGAIALNSRRVDAEAVSTTNSAAGAVVNDSSYVIVLSVNYAANSANCWVNGAQVLTSATLSAGGAGTLANTNGLYDSAIFGSSETFNNPEGTFYAAYALSRAVSAAEAASITNHIRYLRGF